AKRRKGVRSVGFHAFMVICTIVVLYPAAWMLMSSFKPSNEIIGNISLWSDNLSLSNFATALSGIGGVGFWTFFGNSMILAV
ncbi:carbohydrate ABC transporter permease, partial [Isoptericola nanjingensis]